MNYTSISHQLPPSSGVSTIRLKDGTIYHFGDPEYVGKLTEWPWADIAHCGGFVKGELIMLGTRVRW